MKHYFFFNVDYTINLTSSDHLIPLTNKYNLTNCIWPRYSFYWAQCNFPLPSFTLDSQSTIKIGTNNSEIIEIYPFSSIQNAKFLMRVLDENNTVPNFVQVNNNNMSVSIITNRITSVWKIKLGFEAQLTTVKIPYDDYTYYTTQASFTSFSFENNNWELKNIISKNYLVIYKITKFYFEFFDNESDYVIVKMSENDSINSYIAFNSSLYSCQVVILSNKSSDSIEDLLFFYTDSYHQDSSFWMNITLSVYLFASEPPVFDSELNSIQANLWQNKEITLPTISDPDNPNSRYVKIKIMQIKIIFWIIYWLSSNNFIVVTSA